MVRENYKIYKSEAVLRDRKRAVEDCEIAIKIFQEMIPKGDSTWDYQHYNIFNISSSSVFFYDLLKEIRDCVKDFIGDDRRLWLQGWLNSHSYEDTQIGWHEHDSLFHGYVAIDPKKSKTVFNNWEIINEVGNIYVGWGQFNHAVEVLEKYDGNRLTLAFDICTEENLKLNASFFPLL